MRRLLRTWWLSIVSYALLATLGGVALAGALTSDPPSLRLSPEGAETGKTLDSDEPFEMTLHLEGASSTTYGLEVGYGGDPVGQCSNAAAPLVTNPQGAAVWTCTFDTAANITGEPLNGKVIFTVDGAGTLEASLTVRPADEAEPVAATTTTPDPVEPEQESLENHGHCVSYWAHESKARGLAGSARGAFISAIAAVPEAVSEKGEAGPKCDFEDALAKALAEQSSQPAKPSGHKEQHASKPEK